MWVQRKAPLIGRTSPVLRESLRGDSKPQKTKDSPEDEPETGEKNDCLPGLDLEHLPDARPWFVSRA